MRAALRLACRGWGRTSPNPMVGAVVVRDGVPVGRGYHEQAGMPHAEVNALADAGPDARGATLYVTLEPCSTHGRTPPCTQAIERARIQRVVVGCTDANPHHAGRGLHQLQSAGIDVVTDVLEHNCRKLNEAFFWWVRTGRPFVVLKMGMTLDGRIATAGGDSQWITGTRARAHVQRLRRWADVIMVGGETVVRDNPSLTVRVPRNWPRQPQKIVWTQQEKTDRQLKIWADSDAPPLFVKPQTAQQWQDFLSTLGERGITALLLEGGGELAAAALRAGAVNRLDFFVAPTILGGRGSRPVIGGADPGSLLQGLPISGMECRKAGKDLHITGYPDNVHRTD